MDLIYLDNHATTPLAPSVLEEMLPFLEGLPGNPASPHRAAERARLAVDKARRQIGSLVGADATQVVLTASATEANNLALRGMPPTEGRHRVVTSAIEHASVLRCVEALPVEECEVVLLDVDSDGRIRLSDLEDVVDERTFLVSVAAANGEIGTVERLGEIADIAHSYGALVHSDASQAAGKVRLDVRALDVDLVSLSAHKLNGPQGVGALVVGPGLRSRLTPMLVGGGQEGGLRSGSVNVAGAVGFGVACELAADELEVNARRVGALRDRLLSELRATVGGVDVIGPTEDRLPGNLNARIVGVQADALIATCEEVAFSSGSACSSGVPGPSHVLLGLGLPVDVAEECVRFGLGRFTTADEVDRAVRYLSLAILRLREIGVLDSSPMATLKPS